MKIIITLLVILMPQLGFSAVNTIWKSDFSNPNDWTNYTYYDTGYWETSTTIDDVWLNPFNSATANNGYAAFFSDKFSVNYPEYAVLYNSVPIINHSYQNVQLTFSQYYKRWRADDEITKVIIYNSDFSKFKTYEINKTFVQNSVTANPQTITWNIDSCLVGIDKFYIGFVYYSATGNNYAWLIDDVKLTTTSQIPPTEISAIYTMGKIPVIHGGPHVINAYIRNNQASVVTNSKVTLTITGANNFTNTQTISTLQPYEVKLVNFTGFTPTQLGVNNIAVTTSSATNVFYATRTTQQQVTYNIYNYCNSSDPLVESLGFAKGKSGITSVKYHISNAKNIQKINVFISNDVNAIARTVYAVLIDADNKILDRSDDYKLQPEDMGKYHSFKLRNQPLLQNTDFYVGLAQEGFGSESYYPVGAASDEVYLRPNTWFISSLAADLSEASLNYKRMIEVEIGDPDPKICVITSDSLKHNWVVWQKNQTDAIDHYNIYREGAYIDQVPYNQLSVYTDEGVDNSEQQYTYNITWVDTLNNESVKSTPHKTLFLQYVNSVNGVNLSWQPYKVGDGSGAPYITGYNLYKGTDSLHLQFVKSFTDQTAYTDKDPLALTKRMYYRIEGVLATPCVPLSYLKANSSGPFVQSVSNLEDNRLRFNEDGVQNNSLLTSLLLYPNPTNNLININMYVKKATSVWVSITNVQGKQLFLSNNYNFNTGNQTINLSATELNLSNGIYIIKVFNREMAVFVKLSVDR